MGWAWASGYEAQRENLGEIRSLRPKFREASEKTWLLSQVFGNFIKCQEMFFDVDHGCPPISNTKSLHVNLSKL